MTKLILFYITAVVFLGTSVSFAAGEDSWSAMEPRASWDKLGDVCETDWVAFEKRLNSLRKEFGDQVTAMPQKEFDARDQADDIRLLFLKLTFPASLSDKDQFWDSNKDCADVHWTLRKSLKDPATDKKERAEKVEDFRACVHARFDRKKLIAPADRLVKCYDKRAGK